MLKIPTQEELNAAAEAWYAEQERAFPPESLAPACRGFIILAFRAGYCAGIKQAVEEIGAGLNGGLGRLLPEESR